VIEDGPVIESLPTIMALPDAPVANELAVIIPEALTVARLISLSRFTVTVSAAADEVKLVPPEIVNVSVRRSIS
jgi:hypothetical protein